MQVQIVDYQDYINYEEKAILILDDEDAWKLMGDSRYSPILVALRIGPLTVKDLEVEYNKLVLKGIDNLSLGSKDKKELAEKTRRKGKTLYKYLAQLEKAGLIVQAGKRIKMGQTATETLYGRTAKLFYYSDKRKLSKLTESVKKIIPVLGRILSLDMGGKEISDECLLKFIDDTFHTTDNQLNEIFTKYSDVITEASSEIYFDDLYILVETIQIYMSIKNAPELMKQLEKCVK